MTSTGGPRWTRTRIAPPPWEDEDPPRPSDIRPPRDRQRGAAHPARPGAGRRGPARGRGRCRSGRRRRRIARPAGAVRGGRLPGALRPGRASARPGAARRQPHRFLHARRADRPAAGSGAVDARPRAGQGRSPTTIWSPTRSPTRGTGGAWPSSRHCGRSGRSRV